MNKHLVIGISGTTIALIAFIAILTNPPFLSHLRMIKETCDVHYPNAVEQPWPFPEDRKYANLWHITFHNYWFFSITDLQHYGSTIRVSYGFFGRVHTTNQVYFALYQR